LVDVARDLGQPRSEQEAPDEADRYAQHADGEPVAVPLDP